jgi:hypothetical protein
VVPFFIIAMVLEEIIPIIAIYAPAMLPSTWILPAQKIRIEQKKTEKAKKVPSKYAPLLARLSQLEADTGSLPLKTLVDSGGAEAFCR